MVAKEIVSKYPMISIEKAREAAMLEGRISTSKNIINELNRLYNIMLVNSDSKDIVSLVYRDFIKVIKDNKDNIDEISSYYSMIYQINDYIMGHSDFPFIDDYQ
ncbi:MAG: hypothetical protein GX247_05095 [Mollicutes bacterium]|nr:hypothetical protein [Mollicutes bacterium]